MKKLVLIDSNALVHRAFHALPPLSSPTGAPTNAVYGFVTVLLKMIADLKPDYIAATFDLPGPTFRHQEYEEYKAHRQKAPDELYAQIPVVKEVLKTFGIPIYEQAGYEADDVIGSIAEITRNIPDLQTIIVTGDLDTLQLVQGKTVVVFTMRKGMTDTVTYDETMVKERYGLRPEQVVDFKGLKGDPSDNIPGVPGIGEKTASMLIQTFGTIEELYASVEKGTITKPLTDKLVAKLIENKDMAYFSKKLATIIRTVDVAFDIEKTDWHKHLDMAALEATCTELGFHSLIKRLANTFGREAQGELLLSVRQPAEETVSMPTPSIHDGELIGHDLKPYLKELLAQGKQLPKKLFDTKIAQWLLNPDTKQYEYPKGDIVTARDQLAKSMDALGLTDVFETIEMPLIPILAQMERTGILVDTKTIADLLKSGTVQLKHLEKQIYKHAGMEFNINSPAQMAEVLYTKLAIKGKVRHTSGGAPSTAAPELEKLRDEHPIIDLILEYRELNKLKTTYIEPFPSFIAEDSRIHTTYNQTGAATGRMSSNDPNLQNIPTRTELGQQFRAAFIAPNGYQLVSFDYSQLELRLVAHIAHDTTMIEAFKMGEDIHTHTASEIFGVAPAQVTKDMRRQAKVLNFGVIYGMGVLGFARAARVNRETAKKFMDEYFARFPGVAQYMERTKQEAFEHGYVSTLFGRRRPLADIKSTMPQLAAQAERMAINHPIQGTGADLVKLAMIAVDQFIQKHNLGAKVHPLLQVHDELVLEIASDSVAHLGFQIKKIMEDIHTLDVPLVVDIKAGINWAAMNPVKPLS